MLSGQGRVRTCPSHPPTGFDPTGALPSTANCHYALANLYKYPDSSHSPAQSRSLHATRQHPIEMAALKSLIILAVVAACMAADVEDAGVRPKKDVMAAYPAVAGYGAYPYAGYAGAAYPYAAAYPSVAAPAYSAYSAYPAVAAYPAAKTYSAAAYQPVVAAKTAYPAAAYPATYSGVPAVSAYSAAYPAVSAYSAVPVHSAVPAVSVHSAVPAYSAYSAVPAVHHAARPATVYA